MAHPESELLSINPSEIINRLPPDRFSQVCDGFVDFYLPEETLSKTASLLKDGHNVALVTNHQSYFEIETIRYFCQQLNQTSETPIPSLLFYSAPAVQSNIEPLLKLRQPVYQQSGLNLLPIIRDVDRTNKYQDSITPQMSLQTRQSLRFYCETVKKGGCLIISPFESTLQGGRINPMTGQIHGLQPNKEDGLLNLIKKNVFLLPCGIDGSYKVIDPDTHRPSHDFLKSLSHSQPSEKSVTFKIGHLIDPQDPALAGLSSAEIAHQVVLEVAKLISPSAQGAYRQECLDSLK